MGGAERLGTTTPQKDDAVLRNGRAGAGADRAGGRGSRVAAAAAAAVAGVAGRSGRCRLSRALMVSRGKRPEQHHHRRRAQLGPKRRAISARSAAQKQLPWCLGRGTRLFSGPCAASVTRERGSSCARRAKGGHARGGTMRRTNLPAADFRTLHLVPCPPSGEGIIQQPQPSFRLSLARLHAPRQQPAGVGHPRLKPSACRPTKQASTPPCST